MGHRTAGRRAFTLVETLVTLALLIVLATLIVPAMASLKWEAVADRAQAEVVAGLADARSMARATACAVVVTIRRAPEGGAELWGSALGPAELQALASADSAGDGSAPSDPAPEAAAPARAGRRLAVLPERCTLAAARVDPAAPPSDTTDESAAPATPAADTPTRGLAESDLPESLQVAVVFPDGTALVPATAMVLTVPKGPGSPDRVFRLTVNPWFAEARFAEVLPPAPQGSTTAEPEAKPDRSADRAGEAAP